MRIIDKYAGGYGKALFWAFVVLGFGGVKESGY